MRHDRKKAACSVESCVFFNSLCLTHTLTHKSLPIMKHSPCTRCQWHKLHYLTCHHSVEVTACHILFGCHGERHEICLIRNAKQSFDWFTCSKMCGSLCAGICRYTKCVELIKNETRYDLPVPQDTLPSLHVLDVSLNTSSRGTKRYILYFIWKLRIIFVSHKMTEKWLHFFPRFFLLSCSCTVLENV